MVSQKLRGSCALAWSSCGGCEARNLLNYP